MRPLLLIFLATLLQASLGAAQDLPDPLPPVMRNVILWNNNIIDVERAKANHANVVNVYPAPKGTGTWSGSLKPLDTMRGPMESEWKPRVDELNKAGIAVWTSFTTISFEPAVFQEHGLEPETLYAVDETGAPQKHLGGYYGDKVYSSCYNNPKWMELQLQTLLLFAENGFGGVFYDVGGYADKAVLYCHCAYCEEKWQHQLGAWQFSAETPLPTRTSGENMQGSINRQHLRWRYQCWEEAWTPVRAGIKAKYPAFVLGQNMSARWDDDRPDGLYVNAMMDIYDYVHFEEWGHGSAPFSILPSYLMGKAAGNGKPVVLVWNMGPFESPSQQRIAFAEALASGASCQNTRDVEIRREYNDFMQRNEALLYPVESMANVGVVVSFWSRAFHEVPARRHAAWWFGQMLLDLHVPFDYLLAERDLTAAQLARYKTLILPDVACLSDAQIETLAQFVRGGGSIYATHETGKYTEDLRERPRPGLREIVGDGYRTGERLSVEKGRLVHAPGLPEQEYWKNNPRDVEKSKELKLPAPPPQEVLDDLQWVINGSLPVELTAASSTVILPYRQEDRLLLHLVNYNLYPDGMKITPDQELKLRVQLPENRDAGNISLLETERSEPAVVSDREVREGWLALTLDKLDHYGLLVIELK